MGCASTIPKAAVTRATLTLPADPPALVVDSGKVDKSKFPPNTRYVKPPVPDNKRGRAYWSFGDVDKINEALVLRQQWIKDTKEIVEGHNRLVTGEGKKERPWYRP